MFLNRGVKHFVLTLEKGTLSISKAREVVPNRTYEIIEPSKPFVELAWISHGIGLGESIKKEVDEKKKCASLHNH
jgi:hypothetical protein